MSMYDRIAGKGRPLARTSGARRPRVQTRNRLWMRTRGFVSRASPHTKNPQDQESRVHILLESTSLRGNQPLMIR